MSDDNLLERAKALRELPICRELIAEVERLRSVISEPVKSFGTMELVSWVNQLQKTISEYPDAEWGNWPFVLMMGVHCENFSKRWHSPTIELMAARIKELEAVLADMSRRAEWLLATVTEDEAYRVRLEAAFLKARQCPTCKGEGTIHPIGQPIDSICPKCLGDPESMAREALERIKEGRKDD